MERPEKLMRNVGNSAASCTLSVRAWSDLTVESIINSADALNDRVIWDLHAIVCHLEETRQVLKVEKKKKKKKE
jgi:hypothetical protein